MQQLALFADPGDLSPVNVASVPQISPFRYPGGKHGWCPYSDAGWPLRCVNKVAAHRCDQRL
jgi:hypothetical protein